MHTDSKQERIETYLVHKNSVHCVQWARDFAQGVLKLSESHCCHVHLTKVRHTNIIHFVCITVTHRFAEIFSVLDHDVEKIP